MNHTFILQGQKNKTVLLILIFVLSQNLFAQLNFNTSVLSTSLLSAQNIIAEDLDNDGDLDIVSCGEFLVWWENHGNVLSDFEEHVITAEGGDFITARVFDYDKDGNKDIVVSNYDQSSISLWLNNGPSANSALVFSEQKVLNNYFGAHDAIIVDINSDGFNDIIASRGDAGGNGQIVCLMQGNDGQLSSVNIFEGDFCHSVDIADFNGDSLPDIVSSHSNDGVRVFINQGNNTYAETLFNLRDAHFVRAFDLDLDGDTDILCAALGSSVYYLKNNGDATFSSSYLSSDFALFLTVSDINGDGTYDVLFSDPTTQKFKVLQNNGDKTFTKLLLPGVKRGASGLFAADLDNDGDVDLLTTCWNSTRLINIWENTLSPINGVENGLNEIPVNFSLKQNYPNPFNPKSNIKYQIEKSGLVELSVYDLLGRKVSTLVNEYKPTGKYEIEFDGQGLSSGTYLYKLMVGEQSTIRKMLLVK